MLLGGGRGDLETRIAAESAEQDARRLFNVDQFDGGLRVVPAGGLGDPVMPDFADEFFHGSDSASGILIRI